MTSLVREAGSRLDQLVRSQADATIAGARKESAVMLSGDAIPLKPAVHRKEIDADIFGNSLAARPPLKDRLGSGLVFHAGHVMTDLVIRQHAKMVVERATLPDQSGSMSNAKKNVQEQMLSPGRRAEMRPERIGYRLRLLRQALGMTPSEMADSMNMERTYWSRFEGGKRAITETFAAAMGERYGVTLDFILCGDWTHVPFRLAEKMREIERSDQNN